MVQMLGFVFAGLLALPLVRAAPLQGFDDDVSDLIGIAGQVAPVAGDLSKVDQGLSSESRTQRMRACIRATRDWMMANNEEVDAQLAALMAQQSPGTKEMTEDEAASALSTSMVLACYELIDSATVAEILQGTSLPDERAAELFSESTKPRRPTKQQFTLLESVMLEEQQKYLEQMTPDDMQGALGNIGRHMSNTTKAVYVMCVLACLISFGLWALWTMTKEKPPKERSSKSLRKYVKTAARLEKKRG
eukprot:TRINITY_DN84726_c0_g1_i1.p1 TRINITY_DN84726_c0_g1~~TRINITY_DN84726_c0_g1_i1.p1  ORF type:complete len:248 (-),score=61.34 TRINITY_DN84726_c0_g1_i1:103-846(-)